MISILIQILLIVLGMLTVNASTDSKDFYISISIFSIGLVWFLIDLIISAINGGWLNGLW